MSVVVPLSGPPLYHTSLSRIAAELGLLHSQRDSRSDLDVESRVPAQRRSPENQAAENA